MGCSRPASGVVASGHWWRLLAPLAQWPMVSSSFLVSRPPARLASGDAHLTELFTDKLGPNAQGRQGPADGPGLRFSTKSSKPHRRFRAGAVRTATLTVSDDTLTDGNSLPVQP